MKVALAVALLSAAASPAVLLRTSHAAVPVPQNLPGKEAPKQDEQDDKHRPASKVPAAAPEPPQTANILSVAMGQAVVARASDLLSNRSGRALITTQWFEAKIRPLADEWRAFGFQLGTHQSSEMIKGALCRKIPSIAGRIYCSTAETELSEGPRFLALYAGLHADLLQLLRDEPTALSLFVGSGVTRIQSAAIPSSVLPYSSVELTYKLYKSLTARAGFFLSILRQDQKDELSIATPSMAMEYRF